jgi:hypothetical protein
MSLILREETGRAGKEDRQCEGCAGVLHF